MNLQQLKILVLMAEHKKLTAVAEALGLKHPTVSFHMKKLEEYIGAPLYERRHHRIFLTHTAQVLLPYAQKIVSCAQEAEAVVWKSLQNAEHKITIGCTASSGKLLLPSLLNRLRESFPNVNADIKIEKPEIIAKMLLAYEIDFGFIMEFHVPKSGFHAVPLLDDVYGLVLHRSHPLANADSFHPLEIENDRWLIREQGTLSRKVIDDWVSQLRLELHAVSEFGSSDMIKEAVLSGLGVSIMDYMSVFNEIGQNRLAFKKLESVPPQKLCFVYNNKRSYSLLMKQIIQLFSDIRLHMPG